VDGPWRSWLFWKKHVYGSRFEKKKTIYSSLVKVVGNSCELILGEFSRTHLHQFSLMHGLCFFDWSLWAKNTMPFESVFFFEGNWAIVAESLSNELISWLNCSCLLLVNLKHFKFQCSILSQIFLILPVTQPFVCWFVKNWLVEIHLNFTSVFCFKSYLEPNP